MKTGGRTALMLKDGQREPLCPTSSLTVALQHTSAFQFSVALFIGIDALLFISHLQFTKGSLDF